MFGGSREALVPPKLLSVQDPVVSGAGRETSLPVPLVSATSTHRPPSPSSASCDKQGPASRLAEGKAGRSSTTIAGIAGDGITQRRPHHHGGRKKLYAQWNFDHVLPRQSDSVRVAYLKISSKRSRKEGSSAAGYPFE